MKTIPLAEGYRLFEICSAVICGDHALVYPTLDQLSGEDENEWLRLKWDEDGLIFDIAFRESENRAVKVAGSSLFLTNTEGDEEQVMLLQPWNVEQDTQFEQFKRGLS